MESDHPLTNCGHNPRHPDEVIHTLPCRHKVCLQCLQNIKGLMEGNVFSCPLCHNCSQYVRPREEVYGIEANTTPPHADEGGRMSRKQHGIGLNHISEAQNDVMYGNDLSKDKLDKVFSQDRQMHHAQGSEKAASSNRNKYPLIEGSYNQSPANHDHSPLAESGFKHSQTDRYTPSNNTTHHHSLSLSESDYKDERYMHTIDQQDFSSSSPPGRKEKWNTENMYDVPKKYHQSHQAPTKLVESTNMSPVIGGAPQEPHVSSIGTSAHATDMYIGEDLIHRDGLGHGHNTFCNIHNKPVYFFCQECNVLICATCRYDKHKHCHIVKAIEDSPSHTNVNVQQRTDMPPKIPEPPTTCHLHCKPFVMTCFDKFVFMCKDCNTGYNHCSTYYKNHVSLKNVGTELMSKGKEIEWKLKRLEERGQKIADTGRSNCERLVEQTELLKKTINDATEKAKTQLEADRKKMMDKIDEVSEEKINKCTRVVDTLVSVSEFILQAREMNTNLQDEIFKEQYQKALQSLPQVQGIVQELDQKVIGSSMDEENLDLNVTVRGHYNPIDLNTRNFFRM